MTTTPTATGALPAVQAPKTSALPTARSLRAAAQAAAARGQPLVVMTTLAGCPQCDLVRNHYLLPLQRQGQLHAIQLDITDRLSHLQGFSGANTTPAAQAQAWGARFAPVVLFFDQDGQELAERIVGVAVPDLYGDYFDTRLSQARAALLKRSTPGRT